MAKKTKKVAKKAVKKARKTTAKKTSVSKRPAKAKVSCAGAAKIQRKPRVKAPAPVVVPEVIEGTLLGGVEDFYAHVQVIALNLKEGISVGDTIRIKGHTTDITQKVDSMQINHVTVPSAKIGDAVGIRVSERCRKGDRVYKI